MSLYVPIFVCLLANILYSYRGYGENVTPPKSPSIADVIISDENILNATRNIVKQSKYLQGCRKINFPDKVFEVTNVTLNESLCIALYDRFLKIGYFNNGTDGKKTEYTSVLDNQTVFDNAIEASINEKEDVAGRLCHKSTSITSPASDKVKKFVTSLESVLSKFRHCVDMCMSESDNVNVLCMALRIVDEQLEETVKHHDAAKKGVNATSSVSSDPQKTSNLKNVKTAVNVTKDGSTGDAKLNGDVNHVSTVKVDPHVEKTTNLVSKVMTGKSKILSGHVGTNVNAGIKDDKNGSLKPKASPDEPSEEGRIGNTAEKTVNDLDIPSVQDAVGNIEKSTTLSEKTRGEDGVEESLEYNAHMTDDIEQVDDLENGGIDAIDDIQSQIPKQIPQMDNDPIDPKEKIPRLPSMRKDDDSHFYGYVTIIGLIGISVCLIYHHKQKILAMIVEGRRSRGGRGRKRPSTANYRKLDCNLEEAVTSQCNSNVTPVIY